ERHIGTLRAPRRVIPEVERGDGRGGIDDPADVHDPVGVEARAVAVGATNADRAVVRIGQDGVVRGAVEPAVQHLASACESGSHVLAGVRLRAGIAGVGYALDGCTPIARSV